MKKLVLYFNKIYKFKNPDFTYLFFLRESKELLGKKQINFWILLGILFVTFTAIGFANGSLQYLNEKMADPFVKWVSIDVPYSKNGEISKIIFDLNSSVENKSKFKYNSVKGYNHFALRFVSKLEKGSKTAYGRTIDFDSPLLDQIYKDDNFIRGRRFKDGNDIGLIVTIDFLKRYNYKTDANFALMAFSASETDEEDRIIPVPIIAVVKELPGISMFMSSSYFYKQRMVPRKDNPFNPNNDKDLLIISNEDSLNSVNLLHAIESFFNTSAEYKEMSPFIQLSANSTTEKTSFEILINLDNENFTIKDYDNVFQSLISNEKIKSFNFERFYNYKQNLYNQNDENIIFDRIAVEFVELSNIREFKEYLSKTYEIQIDMAQIEQLENYNFVTKLTRIISLILIGFSILSICMFVSNILKKHLEKIKMNIGTFKAFGLQNNILEKIYLTIIFLFVSISMLISLFFSAIFGNLGGVRLILFLLNSNLEENQNYFQLFNWWTLISILSVLIISYIVLKRTADKILSRTPGDLIYDRE